MAGSFCTVCRTRIPKGSRCKRHTVRSPSNLAWHEPGAAKVRAAVLERDRYRCTICGSGEGLEAHHVIAAVDGGPTTLENLITLCETCHLEAEAEKRTG
jgi:5-methylcytosine-specific restriction endonuclease McrA